MYSLPAPVVIDEKLTHRREITSPIQALTQLVEEFGDFVHYRTSFGQYLLVNHPSLIRDVLGNPFCVRNRLLETVYGESVLTSNGDYWLRQRRDLLSEFSRDRVKELVPSFLKTTEERISSWGFDDSDKREIDVSYEMIRIAVANVSRIFLGADLSESFLEAVDHLLREVATLNNASGLGFPMKRTPDSQRKYREAIALIERELTNVIKGASKSACPHSHQASTCSKSPEYSETSLDQFRSNMLALIVGGHETTAAGLTWVLKHIASKPSVGERFYSEVDDVIGERSVRVDDLPKLVYTRKIIDETLRLYPPIWLIARAVSREVVIGGQAIPAGTGILISPFTLHRHREFWHDPESFSPDRFSVDAKKPEPYSYIPFYAGRHHCLGKDFAIAEMLVVLVALAQRFRFEVAKDSFAEIEALVALRIRGLKMNLSDRRVGVGRS